MLTAGLGRWGLGWQIGGTADHPYFTHGGAGGGVEDNLIAYFNGDGVVIMTSGDNGRQIWPEIQRTIASPDFQPVEHRAVSIDPNSLDRHVGHFKTGDAVRVVVRKGDRLFSEPALSFGPLVQILPQGGNNFFITGGELDGTISFALGPDGKATSLILHHNGVDTREIRIDDDDGPCGWTKD